ncbi:MAG: hypothetical protein H0T92_03110 [Pyrinomonadaceae bacterium]|nr:hypothetical protein [Pyrinomonadaceae bacterium]
MKIKLIKRISVICLCVLASVTLVHTRAQQTAGQTLTNAEVIKLVRAGFGDKTLIAIINTRRVRFDLAPDRLIELKRSSVSEKVILAMLARDEGTNLASDDWSVDNPFFDEGISTPRKKPGEASGSDEMNIFGSGSGSRGRTRSRVGSGVNTDDTQTVGSATVRILRPPAETAGVTTGKPKLARTPTLTNQSVIELVDAGFTEGTIIRRIEDSPVGFDFTPEKLAELRRRRVSESVIAAMRAAMSDDQTSRATSPGRTNATPEK